MAFASVSQTVHLVANVLFFFLMKVEASCLLNGIYLLILPISLSLKLI